ncbi:MAG: SGNH/GDSL hydrolase family protein [Clostridia bacterium]|nr:SGNH/GDSL hydrolase family protein [Clostridia bacterium]
MKNYFETYVSNTYAASGNQLYFNMDAEEVRVGRVFYKIAFSGEYNYSIMFSNVMDSTYANGSVSYKNLVCEGWKIHGARIGKCKEIPSSKPITELTLADADEIGEFDIKVSDFRDLQFWGKTEKEVLPKEFFYSDPVKMEFDSGDYLCLEITFSGKMIPYHEESQIPVFVKCGREWKYSKEMPFAGMIGCDRKVKARIGYFGDSITQGIGVAPNSYAHWNALLSEKIGAEYSYWNLGIGYGRANDAASDGAWIYKAMQNDIVFVCYGVNDILQNQAEDVIKSDLTHIVDSLKSAGKRVILQTVPPFDYNGENIAKWQRINGYVKSVLAARVDAIFDNGSILGKEDALHLAKFGGHPNEEGCALWANALFEELSTL